MKKQPDVFNTLLSIALVAGMGSCTSPEIPSGEPPETDDSKGIVFSREQLSRAKIKFGSFQEVELSHDVNAKGEVMLPADRIAEVNTTIGGMLSNIFLQPGEFVKKGQPLCRLVHPDIIDAQQDYISAKYNLDWAENHYHRQQLLNSEDIASKKAFQLAERDYLAARLAYDALSMKISLAGFDTDMLESGKMMDHLDILSPLTGKINAVHVHIGQYAQPGLPLFEVVDNRDVYVELMVFEKDIQHVNPGQRVTLSLSNIGEALYEGEVFTIGSTLDEKARAIPVIVHFNQRPENSFSGMFVAGTIHTGEDVCRALPEEAIVADSEDENYVFYTMDDPENSSEIRFEKVPVRPLLYEDGFASMEILDSLPARAHIVIQGGYYIRSMLIRSVE